MMAIQKGVVGGRLRAKMRQETKTAELMGFPCRRVNTPSVAMPKKRTTAVKTRARNPKK
jgi:hypothetical protein